MAKATLINDAGKKVVVESGSQDAQGYFGQGYKLMGADTPIVNPSIPQGSVAIPNASVINQYNVQGQFGKTGEAGSGLYGTLKETPANEGNINGKINAGQFDNFNNASKADEPAVRSTTDAYTSIFNQVSESLKSGLPTQPSAVNLTQTFQDLRANQGVTELETSLSDLQAQARDIQAISKARTNAEKGKAVPMNVISGRISEEEAQDNARLAEINNSIQTVSSQLQIKYNVIDSIMKYTGTDYANSVDAYNTQFTQNLNVMNTVKGMVDTEKSNQETEADNARANLQIIYNNLSSSGQGLTALDDAQKANITKLELQAGLPQGFYGNVVSKNPESEILSTTTREDGTKKYADIITRDSSTGKISTQSIFLGSAANQYAPTSGGSNRPTESELKRTAISNMSRDLSTMTGEDGYVSPTDFKKGRSMWLAAGRESKEYDESFKSYANPTQYYELGLSY